MSTPATARRPLPPHLKMALDWVPLALFFAGSALFNLYVGTAVLMAATLGILAVEYVRERRVSPVPLVTAIMVLVFGGLTLYLKDPRFIKMKPTVLYALFGCILLGGLFFDRLPIKYVLSQAFELDERGWRKLTLRYGLFFFVLAVLNEIVWRNFSQAIWLDFKVFGIVALMFLFSLAQMPLVSAHSPPDEERR